MNRCMYCKNLDKPANQLDLGELFICEPAKYTYYGDGAPYLVPMNFCPACGKKICVGSEK